MNYEQALKFCQEQGIKGDTLIEKVRELVNDAEAREERLAQRQIKRAEEERKRFRAKWNREKDIVDNIQNRKKEFQGSVPRFDPGEVDITFCFFSSICRFTGFPIVASACSSPSRPFSPSR